MGESVAMNDSQDAYARATQASSAGDRDPLFDRRRGDQSTTLNSWQSVLLSVGDRCAGAAGPAPCGTKRLESQGSACGLRLRLRADLVCDRQQADHRRQYDISLLGRSPLRASPRALVAQGALPSPGRLRGCAFVSGMTLCFRGHRVADRHGTDAPSGQHVGGAGWLLLRPDHHGASMDRKRKSIRREQLGPGGGGGKHDRLFVLSLLWPCRYPCRGLGLVWILYLGSIQVGLAYVFLTKAVRTVPAMEVSVLLLIEPVLNPLWAWWMHRETPSVWTMAGGGLIVLAIVGMIIGTYLAARQASDRLSQSEQ